MLMFRNDYSYGAHPKVLEALSSVNLEGCAGYGDDPHCRRAAGLIRELCRAPSAAIHFFVGGTSANLTAIAAFLRPWEAVISPATGHINVHEGGAVEAAGHKILAVDAPDGKLRPAGLDAVCAAHADSAMVVPRLVYLSNATETGTVYTKEELSALRDRCAAHGLLLFLDGARLGAALTSPACGLTLPDLARLTDAFYIGGTKNGALMGEAMVVANPELQPYFFRAMKQRGSVLAKGFLLGAQFEALLEDGLYWDLARRANGTAQRLQAGLKALGIPLMVDSPTNQIFPIVENGLCSRLAQVCAFEVWGRWDEGRTVIRLVTSFQTREEDVDGLLAALRELRAC